MSEYKLVRLTSNEEIIGKVESKFVGETISSYVIKDGFSLISPGEGRIGFIPFMAYGKAEDGVEIDAKFVMFVIDPADELLDQVKHLQKLQPTSSDLDLPPPKKIVTK